MVVASYRVEVPGCSVSPAVRKVCLFVVRQGDDAVNHFPQLGSVVRDRIYRLPRSEENGPGFIRLFDPAVYPGTERPESEDFTRMPES